MALIIWKLALGLLLLSAEAAAGQGAQLDPSLRGREGAAAGAKQRETIPVGLLFDATGAQSQLGAAALNGARLALQQLGPEARVLISETTIDTQSQGLVAIQAAKRLTPNCRAALGFTDSDSVLVSVPAFMRAGVPFISVGATDPCLPARLDGPLFLACFGDNAQAAAGAQFALQSLGKTAAVLIESGPDYTQTLARFFRMAFVEGGGDVAIALPFASDEFATAVQALVESGRDFDFLYLASLPDDISARLAAIRQAGVLQPIMGGDSFDSPLVERSGVEPTSGVYFTTHAWLGEVPVGGEGVSDAQRKRIESFRARYREAFGTAPPNAFSGLGFDAVNLLVDAANRASQAGAKLLPADLTASLQATGNFEGVTGTISFQNGRVPEKEVWLVQVESGERRLVRAMRPQNVPSPEPCPGIGSTKVP